ncbi:hypothetical protein GCM10009839_93810 [Catenulispora yoronensis]|uniref:Uncharacterized protein n=2 Tax=Catenulispora yoronensis TaxID=450799 RepID=A0ABP5HB68_9ACTN
MPAADELFRTTAGNGTLMRDGRGEDAEQRPAPARERGPGGHNAVAPPNGPGTPGAAGTKGPAKTGPPAPGEQSAGPSGPSGSAASSGSAGPAGPAGSAGRNGAPVMPSQTPGAPGTQPAAAPSAAAAEPSAEPPPPASARKVTAPRRPSGRERHDEKITVYVSPDELLGLEHARITLRGEYGVAVDRGRIVREAVAALLADLDARGRDSILVKRLSSGG